MELAPHRCSSSVIARSSFSKARCATSSTQPLLLCAPWTKTRCSSRFASVPDCLRRARTWAAGTVGPRSATWTSRPNNGFCSGRTASANISPACRATTRPPATRPRRRKSTGWCATSGPPSRQHFWDDNRFPAYTYDKISIGLLDAHQLAAAPDALKVLDKTLDSVWDHLPPGGISRARAVCAAAQG